MNVSFIAPCPVIARRSIGVKKCVPASIKFDLAAATRKLRPVIQILILQSFIKFVKFVTIFIFLFSRGFFGHFTLILRIENLVHNF